MAKHCTNCGHELWDTDKFCAECGTVVGGATPQQETSQQFEYCTIDFVKKGFLAGKCFFVARGSGPAGVSVIATGNTRFAVSSPRGGELPLQNDPKTVTALNEIVKELTDAGWVLLPGKTPDGYGNDAWWGLKFHRPVRS